MMKFLPDSLQSTQFRNYFIGNMLSYHGVQIFIFAESWIVHELNEAPEALGLLGLYASIPILVFNLFGGALADRFSKKLILSVVQICMATVYFFFAYLYSTDYIQYWHVYIIAGIISFTQAFDNPTRISYFPSLLEKKYLSSGVVVDLFAWQGTRVTAPLLAGYIFAIFGGSVALVLAGITTILFVCILATTKPLTKLEKLKKGNTLIDILDGLKYIYNNKPILILLTMSFLVYLAGYSYIGMLPYITVQIYEVGSAITGLLLMGVGIGAVLPTIVFSKSGIPNKRIGICLSLVCTGILSVLFSLSPLIIQSIPLAFILIVLIGFSNSIYVIAVMSAIQIYVDDKFRARIVGVFVLSFSFMSLGSLWVGFLGGLIDSVFSVEKVGVLVALSFGGFVLFTVGIVVYLLSDSLKKIS